MTATTETPAVDPSLAVVTESRANRICKSLEKDPAFMKRLGPKNIPIPKRGGGVVYHYQATVDIVKAMKSAGLEVTEASKDQVMAYSCDYFGLKRPSTLDDFDDEEPAAPVAAPVPEPKVEAVKVEEVAPKENPPEVKATPQAAPEPKTEEKKKAVVKPAKPVATKPEAAPAPAPQKEEAPSSGGTLEGPPATGIYLLLLSCIQLSHIDKTKGADDRRKSLDRLAREYSRTIGAK